MVDQAAGHPVCFLVVVVVDVVLVGAPVWLAAAGVAVEAGVDAPVDVVLVDVAPVEVEAVLDVVVDVVDVAAGAAAVGAAAAVPLVAVLGAVVVVLELVVVEEGEVVVVEVVLVDADTARRSRIASEFQAAGCQVGEASTALEAIVRLGESHFEPDVIAVANPEVGTTTELRAFIEREHPNYMLVTIGPELLDPAGLANWLSSANAEDDMPARIRTLLFAPRVTP